MRALSHLTAVVLATTVLAQNGQHVKRAQQHRQQKAAEAAARNLAPRSSPPSYGGDGSVTSPIIPQNENTAKFAVNGSVGAIPFVNFDIGESYAGLLPISEDYGASELYFWVGCTA